MAVTRMAPGAQIGPALEGWAMAGHGPEGARGVDLVFLPGMAAGPWMWGPDWLERFAEAGYRAWVLRFSGRAGGPTLISDPTVMDRVLALALRDPEAGLAALRRALPGASLVDGPGLETYAAEVEAALVQIGRPAVVVGYSLSGAVAQAVLRRGKVRPAGTVLMCAVPPYGLWRASGELAVRDPALWRALLDLTVFGARTADLGILRRALFPEGIQPAAFLRMAGELRDESLGATLRTLGWPPFAPLPGPRADVAVIGGARDPLVPAWDVTATALWYGGAARLLPGLGHVPMLGAGAGATAAALLDTVARWERARAA